MCPHIKYCITRKTIRDKHEFINCFLDNVSNCQTYKFYNRYGEDYNELGIGAVVKSELRKDLERGVE